jgi:hypothetical protein
LFSQATRLCIDDFIDEQFVARRFVARRHVAIA